MKRVIFKNHVHLCIHAKKEIKTGEELRYDYGTKEELWWRADVSICGNNFGAF